MGTVGFLEILSEEVTVVSCQGPCCPSEELPSASGSQSWEAWGCGVFCMRAGVGPGRGRLLESSSGRPAPWWLRGPGGLGAHILSTCCRLLPLVGLMSILWGSGTDSPLWAGRGGEAHAHPVGFWDPERQTLPACWVCEKSGRRMDAGWCPPALLLEFLQEQGKGNIDCFHIHAVFTTWVISRGVVLPCTCAGGHALGICVLFLFFCFVF